MYLCELLSTCLYLVLLFKLFMSPRCQAGFSLLILGCYIKCDIQMKHPCDHEVFNPGLQQEVYEIKGKKNLQKNKLALTVVKV